MTRTDSTTTEFDACVSRYTGKERDTESGLDYFGARYYGSSMGRMMSPDPMLNSGRPDNPQTWNRYAYALNNPLKFVDPTGLYNLDAGCLQDKKCSEYAKNLRNGLADLTKAASGMKDGAEKDRLQASLKSLGTENDGNNVGVTFQKLDGSAAGHTDALSDSSGKLTGWKVTLDPRKISGSDTYGIDAAHEGTHINNLLNGSFSDFSDEYRAAAIFARPSALMVRRFAVFANSTGLKLVALLGAAGRPGFRFVVRSVPVKSAFTFCNCAISASIARTISLVFMNPPPSSIVYRFDPSNL